ncbi:MAG: type II toxin-antitoxin system Phd/YefM family antitoxin [Syntrophorhabdus sp.]
MVITRNGRPIAILAAVNESNLEETLSAFLKARAVEAVASLQRRSLEQGTERIATKGIEAEIQKVRKMRESKRQKPKEGST